MKRFPSIRVCLRLFLPFWVLAGVLFGPVWAAELLTHGGFEGGTEIWVKNPSSVSAQLEVDPAVSRSGRVSARITTTFTDRKDWPAWEQTLSNVSGGMRLEGRAWVKTEITPGAGIAYLALEFLGADGKRFAYQSSPSVSGAKDWTPLAVKATLPPGTVSVRFRLILHGAGTAWFDDVSLNQNENFSLRPVLKSGTVSLSPSGKIYKDNFGGFGAEIDPWFWNRENRARGVTDADGELLAGRIRELGLPFARIFIPWSLFNPSGDRKTLNLTNDGMESLGKTLALCQKQGVKVLVCGVEWKLRPYEDIPAAATLWGEILEYLVARQGFTCITGFTAWNEPNHSWIKSGYTFEGYVAIHRLLRDQFAGRGLKIELIGSDDSGDQDWFAQTALKLGPFLDGYATHHYVPHDDLEEASRRSGERLSALKAGDPAWAKKSFTLAEFGIHAPGTTDRSNAYMRTFDAGLGIAAICLGQIPLGLDRASIWCLHRIYYPGYNFMDYGLWEFKDENWKPRPVYFAYGLFTKFMPRGSRLLEIAVSGGEGMVLSVMAENPGAQSLFILNTSYSDTKIRADLGAGMAGAQVVPFIYDEAGVQNPASRALFVPGTPQRLRGPLEDTLPARCLRVYHIQFLK